MSKIFISYSHKDEDWKDRLVTHLGVLEKQGHLEIWDDRRIQGGDDWFPEIENAIEPAHIAIPLITANFLTSDFILGEEMPRLLERKNNEGLRIMPLIVRPCAWTQVKWLSPIQARPKDGKALSGGTDFQIDTDLAAFAEEIFDILNKIPEDPDRRKKTLVPPDKIDTAKLPTTDATLFGREKELTILDKAWENPHTKIISFVAWGGVGKSALINAWLNNMEEHSFRGAELVYGWSFYSQGTKEDRQASADDFLNDAFKWFEYEGEIPTSQHEKGRLLANIISRKRTLLILDGLEPLQYPPGEMYGFLKDQAMQALLKGLARSQNGLCIITSRCKVEDIKSTAGRTTLMHELENLSDDAGMQVLKNYEIKGPDKELKETSKEFRGHALALNLVGSYLKTIYDGDIKKRDLIPKLTASEEHGGHARRVMQSYEIWFAEKNRPELDVLNILGLFDRPATKEAIDVLLEKPAISGLTERLQNIPHPKWQTTLRHLRALRLIAEKDKNNPDALDCHPLIREHFGEKLENENPQAWQQAHARLYEYYKNLPEKKLPVTLEEMEPLFAAVRHGCLAGKHHEAEIDVYWKRIKRENEHYSTAKLGAFGVDLACLSSFFESPWDRPAAGLSEEVKPFVLSWAGFALRAVGRLQEATQPMKAGLDIIVEQENWEQSAINANNLSELLLTLGDVKAAEKYAKQSVEFADRRGDGFWMESSRTAHADVFHQAGRINDAEALFIEAENMLKKRQPENPYLGSFFGSRYCDLLISLEKYQDVIIRAKTSLKWVDHLLDIALDNLSIGRTIMLQSIQNKSASLSEAENFLNEAVDGLRESGNQDDLPRGLIARSVLFRHKYHFSHSWADLDEAREIAEYGKMRLHLTDYYLEACRNIQEQLAVGSKQSADKSYEIIENGEKLSLSKHAMAAKFREFLAKAEKLIQETGYHRRDGELEELKKDSPLSKGDSGGCF